MLSPLPFCVSPSRRFSRALLFSYLLKLENQQAQCPQASPGVCLPTPSESIAYMSRQAPSPTKSKKQMPNIIIVQKSLIKHGIVPQSSPVHVHPCPCLLLRACFPRPPISPTWKALSSSNPIPSKLPRNKPSLFSLVGPRWSSRLGLLVLLDIKEQTNSSVPSVASTREERT